MAQEINEQEHIEKPKSPRRAAGTRKKAAAGSGTEAGTDTDARADAGSAASGPRAEDSEAPAEKPRAVRRTRRSTKSDAARESAVSPAEGSSHAASPETAEPAPEAAGTDLTKESPAKTSPAKPRRGRLKKTDEAAPAVSEHATETDALPAGSEAAPAEAEVPAKPARRRASARKPREDAESSAEAGAVTETPSEGSAESFSAAAAEPSPAPAQTGEDAAPGTKRPAPRRRRAAASRPEAAATQASLTEIPAQQAVSEPAGELSAPETSSAREEHPAADFDAEKHAGKARKGNREPRAAKPSADPRPASAPQAGTQTEDSGAEGAGAQISGTQSSAGDMPVPADGALPAWQEEERQPAFYEDDGVVTSILPALDDRDQAYGSRNFRQNGYGNDRRRNSRSRPRSAKGQPGYGQDYPPILPGPMSYDDMASLPGYGSGTGQDGKRAARGRKRRPGQNGNGYDPYAQPAFTPPYPGYDPQYEDPDAILPVAQKMLNGRTDDLPEDFEDDGPQPALPGQPSLALPRADEDIDLDALDEAVNGNRIQPRKPARQQDRRNDRKGRRESRPESRQDARADAELPREPELSDERGKKSREEQAAAPSLPAGTRRVLYVSVVPDEQAEVVITDNGQVAEYFVEMAHQAKIRGNIYKGVINNVDINLQAAFVNFGSGKNGFLQIDEVHPEYWLNHHDSSKGPKYPPIQKVLRNGQEVLVQVVKEPAGTKGAFLTTWISLAGRYLVLTPGQEQIGVSRKVEDSEERARLKELLAGIEPGEDMGVIIRTASEGASKTSIQKDLQYLKRLWKDIRRKGMTEKAPCLIYQEADLAARAVRDYLAEDIHEIWVDDEATQAAIRETTNLLFPRRTEMVKLHQDPRQTLWERFNLQRQLEEVTSREVVLPSGGRLVFDQTEALMAIDINSGKTQGKSNFESMVFRTNMEAAEAIARHLRLRDIGGQVVIDFIEMRDRNHCREVEKTLRNAMRLDRARHDVGRMSSFGLLELVRQRTGTSAISISTEPCPFCHGTGVRRNMEWQALQTLREIQRKLSRLSAQENRKKGGDRNGDKPAVLVYDADFELGLYLLNKKRDRLGELESKYNAHVEIHLKH